MRPTVGRFLHGSRRVTVFGVDDDVRAELRGVGKLAVVDIDRADLKPHRLGILDGKVAEAAGAGDDDPLACPGFGLLDALCRW